MTAIENPAKLTIEYETYGSSDDPPLLMVSGFGTQLLGWPRGFSRELARSGLYVIAYDNRDCGLSTHFDGVDSHSDQVIAAAMAGEIEQARELAPYSLSDMAQDGLGLLSALGIERAHVLGASMGGMIAQEMAILQPERLLSLVSMMSTTGEPEYGQTSPAAQAALLAPAPADREGYIESADSWLIWHSKRWPEAEANRALAAEAYDRGSYPQGTQRQLAAMVSGGSRAAALRRLELPTLVIHGTDDTLIDLSGGRRTDELIPGAQLMLVPDMGHDRPTPLWPALCDAITEFIGASAPAAL